LLWMPEDASNWHLYLQGVISLVCGSMKERIKTLML
jgi:hypothetical protein